MLRLIRNHDASKRRRNDARGVGEFGHDLCRGQPLVARGDIDQFADERFRRELALWMHARRSGDGLAVHGALVTRTLMRTFDIGGRRARSDREIAERSPLLAVAAAGSSAT